MIVLTRDGQGGPDAQHCGDVNNLCVLASATCDGTLFGGDIVNASTTGYWTTWSYQAAIKLEHFTTGASDKTVTTAGTSQNPHLVS